MATVRPPGDDDRPWMRRAQVCPLLAEHRIEHLGMARMPAPFEIVRTALGGSYFLSCFGGRGRVLVEGRWQDCRPGQAFLLSPGTMHAFHARPDGHWNFCWVRYRGPALPLPVGGQASHGPLLGPFAPEPFRHAVSGFHEALADGDPAATAGNWIDLIQSFVRHFANPRDLDSRLARLWDRVEARLHEEWTTTRMAGVAHLSEKQLERLCRRDLGRTPRQHLINLRMNRAAELLSTSDDSVEAIALAVGYQNPFTFSSRFRRFSGWPPSRYPGRSR